MMDRGDLIHKGLILALFASVITDGFLIYSLYSRASQVMAVTTTDRVQTVIMQSYAALVQSQMFLLFAAAVVAVGLIGILVKLRSWETGMGAEEEE